MANRYPHTPDYAVAPGETLQETIDALGMTQRDLALRTGMAPKTINEIIKGKAPITPDTSVLLERVTSVPARLWNNLEANYREQLARISDRERLQNDLEWLSTIPTRELISRGVIPESKDKLSLLYSVLQFFGVGNVTQWEAVWSRPEVAFRKSERFESSTGAVATWLRLGELQAQKIATKAYDRTLFQAALVKIRALTIEPPERFLKPMRDESAAAGVAVVLVPELNRCRVSGVARWLAADKAMIQLSLRYKTEDQFWFSFFHEAGHILHDPKRALYIDDGGRNDSDECEVRANRFAAESLIPSAHESAFPTLTTENAILRFAKEIGISPGIVIGRLQKEGVLKWATRLNDHKRHFAWKVA